MKIVLCGSMASYPTMEAIGEKLKQMGHAVYVPQLLIESKQSIRSVIEQGGGPDFFPPEHPIWKEKQTAINDHFSKIASADAIVVVNEKKHDIEGYVGGNTLMEIAVAYYLKKKIYLLHPISAKLSYKEELVAIYPVVLNGDLSRL